MKRTLTSAILILCFASVSAVVAQDAPTAPQGAPKAEQRGGPRMGRGMGGMRMRRRAMRALAQLNLSDAQRERIRSIHQSARQGTQAKREELRQLFLTRRQGGQLTPEQEARAGALLTELREAHQRTRGEVLSVLTPEQRAQLDKLREERKARFGEMRKRREERRRQLRDGQNTQPPQ